MPLEIFSMGSWLSKNDTVTNFPPVSTGNNKRCFVELTNSPSGYQHQRVINVYSGNPLETFERLKGGSSMNWSSWYRTDNYGTSSLSELASALGVGGVNKGAPNNPDAAIQTGVFYLITQGDSYGYPCRWGILEVSKSHPYIFQRVIDTNVTKIWIRFGNIGSDNNITWSVPWKSVSLT